MLRDYQQDVKEKGLAILKMYGLLYLSMQVRTGKTRTSLAIANDYGAKRVLFLTKKKAIASIKTDFDSISPNFELYVTNYENVVKCDPKDFDFIILDEAHVLSAFPIPANKVKVVKKLCDLKPVIYLSGTPSPESFAQLFHQFYVSCNSPFKQYSNFYRWADEFIYKEKFKAHGNDITDYSMAKGYTIRELEYKLKSKKTPAEEKILIPAKIEEVKREIEAKKAKILSAVDHLFISITQEEAGFKQMVTEEVLKVKMKPSTYWLAKTLLTKRIHISEKDENLVVLADTEVKMQQKLHQVYSGTVKLENGEAMAFDDTKARFISERFKGKKIAIFYCFKAELEILRWAFKGQITDSPEEFNRRDDLTFVCQIQSGSMGTNLSTADALVMYNIHFSALQYQQARARLQHKDRETPAPLYWIFSEGGIEEKIYEKVINKMDYTNEYFRKDFNVKMQSKAA